MRCSFIGLKTLNWAARRPGARPSMFLLPGAFSRTTNVPPDVPDEPDGARIIGPDVFGLSSSVEAGISFGAGSSIHSSARSSFIHPGAVAAAIVRAVCGPMCVRCDGSGTESELNSWLGTRRARDLGAGTTPCAFIRTRQPAVSVVRNAAAPFVHVQGECVPADNCQSCRRCRALVSIRTYSSPHRSADIVWDALRGHRDLVELSCI